MKTLEGQQAIEVAKRYGLSLYDVYYDNEVSVAEAKQFIDSKRDPKSFVLRDWPDSEAEAEDVLLMYIYQALKEKRQYTGCVHEVLEDLPGPAMNPAAGELAALRLGSKQILQVNDRDDGVHYRVPQTTFLTAEFLDRLSDFVCDECAHFQLDKPFHEPCLASLFDAIRRGQFTFDDIVEERLGASGVDGRLARFIRPGLGALQKRVIETTSRFQQALRVPRAGEEDKRDEETVRKSDAEDARTDALSADETIAIQRSVPTKTSTSVERPPLAETVESGKTRLTKRDLIEYLESVEIVDESGEWMTRLAELEAQQAAFEQRLAAEQSAFDEKLEEEIAAQQRVERERDYWKAQYEECQKDLDTLLQAMQIAKRRTDSTTLP